MNTATLHCIYDPLCGWCYAAAPLVEAARRVPGLALQLHGGGMMAGPNRRPVTPQWRNHVMPHDQRIAQLTGQPFGDAYFEGLLRNTGVMMDSEPPTAAVLAAEALAGRGLDMLHRMQRAHYVEGRHLVNAWVLRELAEEIGLDPYAFETALAQHSGAVAQRHFEASRALMQRAGGHGFPTFVLMLPDGTQTLLDASPWLGRALAWQGHLAASMQGQPAHSVY